MISPAMKLTTIHAMHPRTILPLLASVALALPASGAFETWTNKNGVKAELELVSVSGEAGSKTGTFRMKSGRTVQIKAADLSDADAAKLEAAKPDTPGTGSDPAAADAPESPFSKYLDGNLQRLEGKHISRVKDPARPAKYYVFYFSASWCAPCHQFTPTLVDFYNKHKNADFEIILISSDSDDKDLEKYVEDLKQPWPFLKMSKTEKFKKAFNFGIKSIPSMAIYDTKGKRIEMGHAATVLQSLEKYIVKKQAPPKSGDE